MLQRQGQLGPDGTAATRRPPTSGGGPPSRRTPDASRPSAGRRFAAYLRDVRAELAKVLWPKRADVVNYSTVVLSTLVLMAALIFALNYVFAKGVMFLFKS
jgi:preprotein translocase subunit SecE